MPAVAKLTSSPRDQAEPQPRLRLRQCLQVMFGYRLRPATMPRPGGTSHCGPSHQEALLDRALQSGQKVSTDWAQVRVGGRSRHDCSAASAPARYCVDDLPATRGLALGRKMLVETVKQLFDQPSLG